MKRPGRIMPVSILAISRGAATAVRTVNGCIGDLSAVIRRTSASRPNTAAAATIAGLMMWVRAPRPWRPSKLRLVVEAQRSPGAISSPFEPLHIEQPGSRHSRPAATKISISPSASACRFTAIDPGDTMPGTRTRRPLRTSAAARRSSMRLLVQEPMKTRSIVISCSGVAGLSFM